PQPVETAGQHLIRMKRALAIFFVLLAVVCGFAIHNLYQQQESPEAYAKGRKRPNYQYEEKPNPASVGDTRSAPATARTRFRILQSTAPDIFGSQTEDQKREANANWLQTQVKRISSPDVLIKAVKRLNLEAEWKQTAEQAIARVQENMKVELAEGTNVVSLTVRDFSKTECASIANAMRD